VPGCAQWGTSKSTHAFGGGFLQETSSWSQRTLLTKSNDKKERRERRGVVGTELYLAKGSASQCSNYSIIHL